ncbi:MAG TPA: HAMP domain-containing histidine kinase [Campylobacterales bacterium]|nr:HAMP domain-containing histidine kinase [Campylobacterales bacterium]
MKRSIFFSITLIFLIAFLGVGFSFYIFLRYENSKTLYSIKQKFDFISQTILWKLQLAQNPNRLIDELKSIQLEPINYPKEAIKILKKSKKIEIKMISLGQIWLLEYNNDYYIFIQSFGNTLLLKDISSKEVKNRLYFVIFGFIVTILFFAYIATILKLRPLKTIQKELQKFSNGVLDLDLDIKGGSEITEVAKTLKDATSKLKNILKSRELLLRNIMHELKTPITKGRIIAEMIENDKQKERLVNIFERLNSLINELAAIEAINSKIDPKLQSLKVSEIIKEAINLGIFDKNFIEIKTKQDPKILADYKLLAIAIKNLIENGIKYSKDNKIKIVVYKNKIEFLNSGDRLKDFNLALEPFTKEGKESGFGLGLYLVNSILKLHNFRLSYQYKDNLNIFVINFFN